MLKNKWLYAGLFIFLFPFFLLINLNDNTSEIANQNTNLEDVSNAEKVQARLNLIIAGTSDTPGDAERTSGSFANTSKALGSALHELSVDVITPMLPRLTKMAEGFIDATDGARTFFKMIGMLNRDLSTTALRQDRIDEIEKTLSKTRENLFSKIFDEYRIL